MKKLTKCQEEIDKKTEIYYYIFNTEEVVKVCYKNYFQFMEQEKKKEKYMLHEESETYTPQEENPISYKHDKTYKDILSDKEEVAYIINQVLDKIDYSMPYRLEEYRMEIIRSAIDEKKVKTKNYKMPEVIPIVIYTGEEAWKVRIYLRKLDDELFQNVDLLKYNVIDINQYTQEELLESNHLIDKVFLMEKTKSGEEFAKVLEEIFSKTSKKERQKLCDILKWLLQEKLTDDKVKELIKKAEGEDEDMLAVVEMLRNENRMLREEGRREGREEGKKEGRREGVKEGIRKMVKEMKKKGLEDRLIKEITGLSSEEIRNIN